MKERFEKFLCESLDSFGKVGELSDAIAYALLSGGKRVRPLLVMQIGEALGCCDLLDAALSVEFFHTASLIADDMPCMDNDRERRGRESLHVRYGETTALLSSYALISAAFDRIYCAGQKDLKRGMLALKEASRLAGIHGATGGQYLDLFPEQINLHNIEEAIYKKTITLFEASFLFGWIFAGGDLERLEEVRKAAYHFGMAFQISDDLLDLEQDDIGSVNLALHFGKDVAFSRIEKEIEALKGSLRSLKLDSESLMKLVQKLEVYALAVSN